MNKNITTDELAEALEKTSQENKKFLSDIDKRIRKTDLKYAQMIIEEEKDSLILVKKSLSDS